MPPLTNAIHARRRALAAQVAARATSIESDIEEAGRLGVDVLPAVRRMPTSLRLWAALIQGERQ